ncbi:MAG: N-acetyltransferase [Flavobacterium sp. MedPE-SWcel]|uniref:GNAT family N-acetyltransferase n=1 Tax=uncultured Flavobacterium sp. TaxID=165435 RepID=UPI000919363B|nr:GNAT family N-acetyltransferase [uncultured Flavobacterium sp.]OIQ21762.1 MAG: N-acetyltransferase [Flavobacterium sp. MedPE-SWcel]
MQSKSEATFRINESQNQFELEINGVIAFLEYYRVEDKIFVTHTEAPQELRGTGAASSLVSQTLQYVRDNKLTVVPLCSYVAKYIDNHPE